MQGQGDILVVSCYELGRQPVAAAGALAALESAGFLPAVQDVAVDKLSEAALKQAQLILISAPMHTALQLGVRVAARARAVNPSAHVAFFGLYAALNAEHLRERHCDTVVSSEDPAALVELVGRLAHPGPKPEARSPKPPSLPSRRALPTLDRYARLEIDGESRLVASVEATRGCKHLCKHCPIVPVYGGKFVAVPRETVLGDIAQQIEQGARHVSFGDPDFLNGPTHALRIVRELHQRWPPATFDATIKIEHLLQHRALLPELVECGLLFVTSAVECLDDGILRRLDKGHVAADVPVALRAVRAAGAELRPSLMPYTPWTSLEDLPALFDFAVEHDLVDAIDPVQYTMRLLLPPGSLLIDRAAPWLRAFDAQAFSWSWVHPDPRVDALWRSSAELARLEAGSDPRATFVRLRDLADRAVQRTRTAPFVPPPHRTSPRLSEPWFC